MNSENWEIINSHKLINKINKLNKKQYIIDKKLKQINNKIDLLTNNVNQQNELNTNIFLENKMHTKNIRDMLEMFNDLNKHLF